MVHDHIIVEVNQEPAGILARIDEEYQFFASSPAAFILNLKTFPSVREAITAVADAVGTKHQ